MAADTDRYLAMLRREGEALLVAKEATRGRALEIRRLAKEAGLNVSYRQSRSRSGHPYIVLVRQS